MITLVEHSQHPQTTIESCLYKMFPDSLNTFWPLLCWNTVENGAGMGAKCSHTLSKWAIWHYTPLNTPKGRQRKPLFAIFRRQPKANLWTGSDLRNVFTNPFGLLKMVSGRICYIWDAVFAKRKYTVDINCLRLQYFSSQSRLYCILKQRRNHIHSKQIWSNILFRVPVPLVGQISLLHIFLVG